MVTPPEVHRSHEKYGATTDVRRILAGPGGKYGPAIKLRQMLSQMVVEAWE